MQDREERLAKRGLREVLREKMRILGEKYWVKRTKFLRERCVDMGKLTENARLKNKSCKKCDNIVQ